MLLPVWQAGLDGSLCCRARKRAHVEELQAKVAVQEHANAILRHKLAERDAEIQGLLTQTDAPQQGRLSCAKPLRLCLAGANPSLLPLLVFCQHAELRSNADLSHYVLCKRIACQLQPIMIWLT